MSKVRKKSKNEMKLTSAFVHIIELGAEELVKFV